MLFAQASSANSNSAIVAFVAYISIVMFLAWLSSRVAQRSSFLSEYFLGGRNLGVWAFALTFAATSASGGSFIGFPSLVYTHGWSVGLWISSYMLVPLVAMGLLAKRLNQVARRTDAITIPDLIRERFASPVLGLVATLLIIFFMTFNLIAQFKGGSVILQTLLSDVPLFQDAVSAFSSVTSVIPFLGEGVDPSYLLCLVVFALAVVVYTTYGGFRAVVWTDVLQGVVMVIGILILLPMTLIAVGGLRNATEDLAGQVPPVKVQARISATETGTYERIEKNALILAVDAEQEEVLFRLAESVTVTPDQNAAGVNDAGEHGTVEVLRSQSTDSDQGDLIEAIQLSVPRDRIKHEPVLTGFKLESATAEKPEYGADTRGVYVTAPGPSSSSVDGFLPLAAAISFFFFWCFASAGQPSNMIRCMAFRDSKTLAKAIMTVSIYYSLIYFPIVIIFCCARTLLPGWESASDRIMPEMASNVTAIFGVPWLAGLLVAAPFAAVMSTMDSFLLMISSSVVRDVYQRWIEPEPTEKRIKTLTYSTTFVVGIAAMIAAINPPQFLQDIIVFTGAGLATSFLVPVALALYWPRFNYQGAIAGMLTGFFANIVLYAIGTILTGRMSAYQPLGFHPLVVGLAASLLVSVVVCLCNKPPESGLVKKFFYRQKPSTT